MTQICKFIALDNTPPQYFRLGIVSKRFTKDEINKISLKGTMYIYDVSTDYGLTSIDRSYS